MALQRKTMTVRKLTTTRTDLVEMGHNHACDIMVDSLHFTSAQATEVPCKLIETVRYPINMQTCPHPPLRVKELLNQSDVFMTVKA